MKTFDGEKTTGCTLGYVYEYSNGQSRVTFERGGARDWFIWSEKRQERLATFSTRRELEAAYRASVNDDGPYGCAVIRYA